MKKVVILLTIIISFIFNISNIYALDVMVENVKVLDKSDTITVDTTTTSGLTITPKLTFHNVSDYVIYKITFAGTDLSKYEIAAVKDNNTSEYIKTEYRYDKTLSSPLYITIKYQNATSSLSLNDINVSISLTGEGGAVVINDPGNDGGNSGSNPQTGVSSIIIPIIILIITIPLINYYAKYSKGNTIASIILIGLIIVPLTVIAASSEQINLVIKTSNISIGDAVSKPSSSSSKPSSSSPSSSSQPSSSVAPPSSSNTKYYVLLYPNGGTGISNGYRLEYEVTTYFTNFPSVTKSGCSLTGWNVGSTSGKLYVQNVEPSDSGQKLYAHWNCGSTTTSVSGTQGTYYAPIQTTKSYSFGSYSYTAGCNKSVYHDIAIGSNVPLYAGIDGTAEFIQIYASGKNFLISYGNQIKLTSTDGKTLIIYAHLNGFVAGINTPITQTCPKKGSNPPCPASNYSVIKKVVGTKTVKKGDLIGYTGDTGNSTGPHLHVEIKVNGACVCDPYGAFGMRSKKC